MKDKIYLKNYDNINEIVVLNLKSGKFSIIDKSNEYKIAGIFAKLGDKQNDFSCIYVVNGEMYFQINENKWLVNHDSFQIQYKKFLIYEKISVLVNNEISFTKKISSAKLFKDSLLENMDKLDEYDKYFLMWLSDRLINSSWKEKKMKDWDINMRDNRDSHNLTTNFSK